LHSKDPGSLDEKEREAEVERGRFGWVQPAAGPLELAVDE